jgi:heme/copper-type cytochrome/quinol oxidase subunit 2
MVDWLINGFLWLSGVWVITTFCCSFFFALSYRSKMKKEDDDEQIPFSTSVRIRALARQSQGLGR